ncbi:MAG: TetR/AcrR family transcriptional regulator, partial [Perlucidibaca sp.]
MNRPREFEDTREHLLATGEAVIRSKGFAGVGLAEILAEAGVPKGSFYHYFRSKEGFGADMLKRYFERYDQDLQHMLLEGSGRGRLRLLNFFRRWAARHGEGHGVQPQCQQACLAVKLS